MIRYLENLGLYSLIFRTVALSMPLVFRTIIAAIPIFMGVTFLGMSLFWESDRFKDTSTTMFTLFALMNGDMIWDTYADISSWQYLLGQLYLYAFVFFSICVMMNVFIIIIEEGYV